jgi:hypothetical protein
LITVSKPSPANERLISLSFSEVLFLEANITEASHPYPHMHKYIRYLTRHKHRHVNTMSKTYIEH